MANRLNLVGTIELFVLITFNLIFFTSGKTINAYHGQEVTIKLHSAYFTALTESGNPQVKVIVNYTMSNSSLAGQKINAVMKVYSLNMTLLKTTSFPTGFVINKTGTIQLLTNIRYLSQDIMSITTFTNLDKTLPFSNPLKVTLHPGQSIK
ncbi:MAG: hypothetical protein ABJB85_07895 [Nitrososphaerota archaeon]